MPVTNGSSPEAPEGGHRSHVGTLLDAVPVAPADAPPELVKDEAREAFDNVLVVPPEADAVAAVPELEVPAAAPVGVDTVGCVVVGVAFVPAVVAVVAVVLFPRVTTPPFVTLYGFAVVCANAGAASAKENSPA